MTAVVEVVKHYRERNKRELAKDAVRQFASTETDFVMYAMVAFIMFITAMNAILLVQIAGYAPAEAEPVWSLFKGGFYAFMAFMALAIGKLLAGLAVDHWDDQEVTSDGQ